MVVVLAAGMVAPGMAAAQQGCPEANPTYTDACGPTFVLPGWGDGGGWTDASKYSTIQLADFDGDGRDELMARNDQGLEIYWFDTTLGHWRPQVDANGVQQVLTDFRSPLPSENLATDWTKSEYYSTIQAADIDGQPGEEILGRFSDGMRVYRYSPPAGGSSIEGGSWSLIGQGGPFSDAGGYDDPSLYPTIQVARFSSRGRPALFARLSSKPGDPTIAFYAWSQGTWTKVPDQLTAPGGFIGGFSDAACAQPYCFLNLSTANIDVGDPAAPLATADVVGLVGQGVTAYDLGAGWHQIGGYDSRSKAATAGPFAVDQVAPERDCPFTTSSPDCIGSSPSYYETLGAANVDGQGGDEVLARASDGLRVKRWVPPTGEPFAGQFQPLATLGALAGGAASVSPGEWGSIRGGDVNGDGSEEVLALDGQALQAWSYDPTADAWSQLHPSTPLALTGDWMTKPEYYSTLRVGDVDGDGHDDVVARGQFGIRTWFYNRRGTGGWERYLAGGYANFPDRQQAAFGALNALALQKGAITSGNIRDVWTGETAPDKTTLSTLQTNLAGSLVGNCSNETSLAPPTYASCVPPAGNNSFTAADWTAVVNELLGEAYFAEQVVGHFGDLRTIAQGLFDSESGSLPAIANDLQLAGGAGNTASFDLQDFFSDSTGIAGSIAGAVEAEALPEVSAALWVVSGLMSMLPSASDAANSTFQTTYSGLLDKLATARDEMLGEALPVGQQQVLGDQALLELVGRLRSSGTWTLDLDGMQSAGRQAFALQTYQALLPTMYRRYVVTSCTYHNDPYHSTKTTCSLPSIGPYVIAGRDGLSATWLGPPDSSICPDYGDSNGVFTYDCNFGSDPGTLPDSVSNIVWGGWPANGTCNYRPPNKATVWTYGCPLAVPIADGIGADSRGWSFTTYTGDPIISGVRSVLTVPGVIRASAARAGASARGARDSLAPLQFSGRRHLSRALRFRRMRVVVDRTLFEHGRREQLALSRSGRRLRPFALRHVRDGLFTSRRRGTPRGRLRLRRIGGRALARVDLRLTRVRTRDVRALCSVLPASVSPVGRPLELETRLRLRDGKATQRITMRQRWRCVRDRKGEFTGIRPITLRRAAARPGLAVRLHAPRVAGRRATVLVTVTNRRRPRPSRVASSLWHLRITGTAGGRTRTVGFKELRARHSRRLRLNLPARRVGRRLACVRVAAAADSARPAGARRCVRAASPPRVTG